MNAEFGELMLDQSHVKLTGDVVSDATKSVPQGRPRVVIIGAGFAGLAAAKALSKAPFDVVVIDEHNYHLFQPLLYQVATAAISPASVAAPIRAILDKQTNARVILARASGVDVARCEVIAGRLRFAYDYLILATGAENGYFGHEEWKRFAPSLKTIDDATHLRSLILLAFERAEIEADRAERRRLLNFVIIGGGPTGVELAGAIAELSHRALEGNFRGIDPHCARIILVEAGSRLLMPFDPSLSAKALLKLQLLQVEVRLGSRVTDCDKHGVAIGSELIEARTIVWAAGVKASPVGKWLSASTDSAGRVQVETNLSVPGHPNIFVLGDTASVMGRNGKPLPGVAPVAKQQGQYVAGLLLSRVEKRLDPPPFRYRDFGSLATIGRNFAIMERGKFKISGFFAWVLWGAAHIYFLIGFRNRLVVALSWLWNYTTSRRGARLITGLLDSYRDNASPPTSSPQSGPT